MVRLWESWDMRFLIAGLLIVSSFAAGYGVVYALLMFHPGWVR